MTLPSLRIPWTPGDEPAALREREWLVTNGLGGFASGSVLGVPTRRYHGGFVPNLADPRGRHVVLPRIDELVETGDERGDRSPAGPVNLGGAEHLDGRLSGAAHRHLREFRLEGTLPVWTFEVEGRVLERSVVMPHGRNAVCVRWRLLEGAPLRLVVRPYAGARRQDAALVPDERLPCTLERAGEGGDLLMRLPACGVAVRLRLRPGPGASASDFVESPRLDRDVLLRTERERGYDHAEHQHSPGHWTLALRAGQEAAFLAGIGEDLPEDPPGALFAAEQARAAELLASEELEGADDFERRLVLAADAFLVVPGSRREALREGGSAGALRSVMAGYHWFNDWGRDTMIALEGLALATGRHAEARATLRTFASYIRDGLLPNLFPEGGREALYHTVDATFWFFHALGRYLERSGDAELVAELYPVLEDVIRHHRRGTRFGIGMDPGDGLIHAEAEGLQLTWMDAKVDDWVVTPRRGKPVEIQALWYNALRLMAAWGRALGAAGAAEHEALAARVRASFQARFWSDERGHLLDVADGPDGDDASLRPNQVFALSLTYPVLDERHWRAVIDTVEQRLLTPFGLRTLAPGEDGYRPRYEGALRERDAAYHQGTVWPWLLGHFFDAWVRVHGHGEHARALLQAFPAHLLEAGVGSISEVFDAEPPQRAGGCIAQAWSVAEVLRAWQTARRWQEGRHG